MWKIHGLKKLPKIIFRETKQIIPHKNLFGTSNFATNAFDVVIQLANGNRSGSARPQPVRSNKDRTKSDLDNINNDANGNDGRGIGTKNINELMIDVFSSSNGGYDTDRGNDIDTDTDSDIPHETDAHRTRGESDFVQDHVLNDRSSAISLIDVLEEENGNENRIGIHRQNTNIMKEGQNLGETQIINTQDSNLL